MDTQQDLIFGLNLLTGVLAFNRYLGVGAVLMLRNVIVCPE